MKYTFKSVALLLLPILLFFLLVVPYSRANTNFIVDWLGCGCPRIDASGNVYEPAFNANDFTALFWLFVAICSTVLALILSKKLIGCPLTRAIYVICIAVLSFFIAYTFYQQMMWN